MNASARSMQEDRSGPDIFIIAGESSGDQLGASLIEAILRTVPQATFRGIGGPQMTAHGLDSLFPMTDIAVMGFLPVLKNLRRLLARINTAAQAVIENPPDVLVIIDSPDFTHRVAKKVRASCRDVPIINYVSPTVWAWRPGRARKMRPYVDHLLALLPFEPQAHEKLGGPDCTYVGHPLIERLDILRGPQESSASHGLPADEKLQRLLLLPGSRRSEVQRLMPLFGEVLAGLHQQLPGLQAVLPAVSHVESLIRELTAGWPVQPHIVTGEDAKYAAMRTSGTALAASGTVTLELALAAVPTVLVYKVSKLEEKIVQALVLTQYAGLPNIILGRGLIPEFLQEKANCSNVTAALIPLLRGGPEREAQLAGFSEVYGQMQLPEGETPSARAAHIVLDFCGNKKGP